MMTKLQFKGMTFTADDNGTYQVSSENGKYTSNCKTFAEATSWIFEMADNNDIGNQFCKKICKKLNCDVYGDPIEAWC